MQCKRNPYLAIPGYDEAPAFLWDSLGLFPRENNPPKNSTREEADTPRSGDPPPPPRTEQNNKPEENISCILA